MKTLIPFLFWFVISTSYTGPAAAAFEQFAGLAKVGVFPEALLWTYAFGQNPDSLEKAGKSVLEESPITTTRIFTI
jgi:hypothetical protein